MPSRIDYYDKNSWGLVAKADILFKKVVLKNQQLPWCYLQNPF